MTRYHSLVMETDPGNYLLTGFNYGTARNWGGAACSPYRMEIGVGANFTSFLCFICFNSGPCMGRFGLLWVILDKRQGEMSIPREA